MHRLPRDAPTPAAVVTYVALGTFALTYALMSWNDALDQAVQGDWSWPLDPGVIARASAGWALSVALWCAVAWVAGGRHPWRVAALAATLVGGWTLLAWLAYQGAYLANGWYVPWPGPVPGTTYAASPSDSTAVLVMLRPGVVTPLALVAAVTVTAWLASRKPPGATVRPSPGARRTALAVLVPPSAAALLAASLLQLAPVDASTAPAQRFLDVLVTPTTGLLLAVGAALLLGGSGRGGRVLLGLVWLAVVGPLVLRWWSGGADALLATAALGTVAIGLAAAVRPAATALSRLDDPRPPPASVPERADAHDGARA